MKITRILSARVFAAMHFGVGAAGSFSFDLAIDFVGKIR